jgi:dsDNA-specific endonuclease/ATPase MutS2
MSEDLKLDEELLKVAKNLAREEAIKSAADDLMMKKITMYEEKITRLKGDVERLAEENSNYEIISKSHKELNGELQKELNEVKEDNKKLAKQVSDYQQNYIRIDGKK